MRYRTIADVRGTTALRPSITPIVVIFRNDFEQVAKLLLSIEASIIEAGCSAKPPIVVINDDEAPSFYLSRHTWTVVAGHGNVGFGAAVNIAIPYATSDYIFIVNPDCQAEPSELQSLFAEAVKHDMVLYAPLVKTPSGAIDYKMYENWTFTPFRRASLLISYVFFNISRRQTLCRGIKLPGTAIVTTKSTALSLGSIFDEQFFLYGEDRDLALRCRRIGIEQRVVRSSNIVHIGGESGAGIEDFVQTEKIKSNLRIAMNRYGRLGFEVLAWNLRAESWIKDRLRGTRTSVKVRSDVMACRRQLEEAI